MNKVKKIITFIISFIIVIVCIEIWLNYSKIGQKYLTTFGLHNERYFRPNMNDFFYKESFGIIKTNEYGFIDYKSQTSSPKKTINLYGDGFLESMQVFPRLHFGQKIADQHNFYLRNFGISGLDLYTIYNRMKKNEQQFPSDIDVVFLSIKDFKYYNYDDYFPKASVVNDSIKLGNIPVNKDLKAKLVPVFQSATLINSINLVRRQINPHFIQSKLFSHPAKIKENYPSVSSNKYPFKRDEVKMILSDLKKRKILFVYIGGLGDEVEIVKLFDELNIPLLNLEEVYRKENVSYKDLYYFPSTKTSGHWTVFAHQKLEKWIVDKLKDLDYI